MIPLRVVIPEEVTVVGPPPQHIDADAYSLWMMVSRMAMVEDLAAALVAFEGAPETPQVEAFIRANTEVFQLCDPVVIDTGIRFKSVDDLMKWNTTHKLTIGWRNLAGDIMPIMLLGRLKQ